MKKFLIAILSLMFIFSLAACGSSSEETLSSEQEDKGIALYATVMLDGQCQRSKEKFQAKDLDGDGFVQLIEALQQMNSSFFVIHDYETIDDYFAYEIVDDGVKITKFFAKDGLDIGVYVNDEPVSSLYDAVFEGDRIYVFSYTDTENHSDVYTYFTKIDSDGTNTTFQLMGWVRNDSGELVKTPIAGAQIPYTNDEGEEEIYETDSDGKVTLPCGDKDIVLIAEFAPSEDEEGTVSSVTYLTPVYDSALAK